MAFRAKNLFNDATTRSVGGVEPDQLDGNVADLVQQMLSATDPQTHNLRNHHNM
jgi:hypothetical protein